MQQDQVWLLHQRGELPQERSGFGAVGHAVVEGAGEGRGRPRDDLSVGHHALAGMQSGADMQPQLPYPVADRLRAPDGARRSVEGREEDVPGGVDLAS